MLSSHQKINSQSIEDTQVGYISLKYTLDNYTLEKIHFGSKKLGDGGDLLGGWEVVWSGWEVVWSGWEVGRPEIGIQKCDGRTYGASHNVIHITLDTFGMVSTLLLFLQLQSLCLFSVSLFVFVLFLLCLSNESLFCALHSCKIC